MSSSQVLEAPSQHVNIKTMKKLATGMFTHQNVGIVKKINNTVLPVSYSDQFYESTLAPELEDYCRLAFYNDIPIGTMACKFESSEPKTRLYLATLCVLAPYRHQGVGSFLVDELIKRASLSGSDDPSLLSPEDRYPILSDPNKGKDKKGAAKPESSKPQVVSSIFLHVHTANEGARSFWESKGFKVISTEEQYFTKLEPRSAWVMERDIDQAS